MEKDVMVELAVLRECLRLTLARVFTVEMALRERGQALPDVTPEMMEKALDRASEHLQLVETTARQADTGR